MIGDISLLSSLEVKKNISKGSIVQYLDSGGLGTLVI